MVDDEALVPAVEVLVRVDLDAELLQHRLVGALAHRVHGGAHVIEDAHDARRILPSQAGRFTLAQTSLHQLLIGSAQYLARGVGTQLPRGEAGFKPPVVEFMDYRNLEPCFTLLSMRSQTILLLK